MMNHLKSMTCEEIGGDLKELGQPAFRAKQLFGWIHEKQVREISQMHNLGKNLLEQLYGKNQRVFR